jgi:hypothetical protein
MAWQNAVVILALRYLFFGRDFPGLPTSQSSLFTKRYTLHNSAFNALASTLSGFSNTTSRESLRFVLIPVIVLALVSALSSPERDLCISLFSQFQAQFSTRPNTGSSSATFELTLEIPWTKLDAFSATAKGNLDPSALPLKELNYGAVEWNWGDMLRYLDLDLACKSKVPLETKFPRNHSSDTWKYN